MGTLPNQSYKGVIFALVSAVLFGASTPLAKLLLGSLDPVLLAGLLYLGSGVGLTLWQILQTVLRKGPPAEARVKGAGLGWLFGAILLGGVAGPVLLMLGLKTTPASSASLLLNLEGVFTALLAWFVFKENFDRRLIAGMVAITCGGLLLSWQGTVGGAPSWGAVAICLACLCWAADNNLTRKVSEGDPIQITAWKGLAAGSINCLLAFALGSAGAGLNVAAAACLVGLIGYGVSLSLFVLALRHTGAARTSAYFSVAPFAGSLLSILLLKDAATPLFCAAATLMGIGVWLHLTERHEHEHRHEAVEHVHSHVHDEHHQHEHDAETPAGEPHSHPHRHEALIHSHPHYPDIHHQHDHAH